MTKKSQTPKLTAAYCRVSTDEQAKEGFSLETQQARLEALAAAKGVSIDKWYVDAGKSARTLNRAQMQALLDDVKAGRVGTILVPKLDRMFRNTRELLNTMELVFETNRVKLVSASEDLDSSTAAGKMFITMLGGFAKFESDRISERTREVLQNKAVQGKVYSRNTPFGFVRDGDNLVQCPAMFPVLQSIVAMHQESKSLNAIARHLNEQGVAPNNGGVKWFAQTVKCILNNHATKALM